MNKRVTILCSSFPPETGAAPGRMQHLADLLQQAGYTVSVITAMPNYPTGRIFPAYRGRLWQREQHNGISVFRTWLIPSNSNKKWHRALSLLSYICSLFLLALPRLIASRPQVMILSSPPFVTGYFGLWLARFTRTRTLLNVSDLWPGSAQELGFLREGPFLRFLQAREKSMYRRAGTFSVQSEEIAQHIRTLQPGKPLFLYRNLPDAQPEALQERPAGKRKIVYAGLLGIAQSVYDICCAIDFAALGTELHIYGAGNEQEKIAALAAAAPRKGIFYHGTVPAADIPGILVQYHAMLIPLRTPLAGAVPSKIFNAMANGLPILFSGDGEAADIVRNTRTGLVNSAGDYKALQQNISRLLSLDTTAYEQLRSNCRNNITGLFQRQAQDKAFLDFLEGLS
jgi:glycosyltransferase involved in cell wall biosynthesis